MLEIQGVWGCKGGREPWRHLASLGVSSLGVCVLCTGETQGQVLEAAVGHNAGCVLVPRGGGLGRTEARTQGEELPAPGFGFCPATVRDC